jgi:hypothetical protein
MDIIQFFKTTDPKILAGYVFMLTGGIMALLNFRAIMLARFSATWKKTKGIILDSKLVTHSSSDSGRSYKPKIVYQYSIRDIEYKSKRVYFGSNIMSSFKKNKSQAIVNKYPKDKEVDVYYNPYKEKMAVLETGVKSEIISGLIFGIILFLTGVFLANSFA